MRITHGRLPVDGSVDTGRPSRGAASPQCLCDSAGNPQSDRQIPFASNRVLDASVLRLPDGTWRMWYNDENAGKTIFVADSADLKTWTDRGKAIGDRGEGPKVFRRSGYYRPIVDQWEKRPGRISLHRRDPVDEAAGQPPCRSRYRRGRQGPWRPRRCRGLRESCLPLLLHPSRPPARCPQDRHRAVPKLDSGRRVEMQGRPSALQPRPTHPYPLVPARPAMKGRCVPSSTPVACRVGSQPTGLGMLGARKLQTGALSPVRTKITAVRCN